MKQFLKSIHHILYKGSIGLFFYPMYPVLSLYAKSDKRFIILNKFRYYLGLFSSAMVGIRYKYYFETEIDWSKTYIICPNHTSTLDATAMSVLVKENFAFMGKEELLTKQVTGFFFRTLDIPVNRDSKISAFRAFKKAEGYLKKGINVIIFAEGKIPDDYPPILHPFKNGPFRLAIEQNIPIIPVTIYNTWQKLWDDGKKFGSNPGVCDIFVHNPIDTTALTIEDTEKLKEQVYNIIKNQLTTHEA